MTNFSGVFKLGLVFYVMCCIVFSFMFFKGINLVVCIESFLILIEVSFCSIFVILEFIFVGIMIGLEICMIKFFLIFVFLKSLGFIERSKFLFLVWMNGFKFFLSGGSGIGCFSGSLMGFLNLLELLGGGYWKVFLFNFYFRINVFVFMFFNMEVFVLFFNVGVFMLVFS